MDLGERVAEEMYVDTESILEEEFDRAKDLYDIYGDNKVVLDDRISEASPQARIITHLLAQQYVSVANEDEGPTLSYDYFYERFDKDDSTIRHYFGDLVNEGLVKKTEEQGHHSLVIERTSDVIDRIISEIDA